MNGRCALAVTCSVIAGGCAGAWYAAADTGGAGWAGWTMFWISALLVVASLALVVRES